MLTIRFRAVLPTWYVLVQAELDRVAKWEERLAAEAASLQRREEAHTVRVRLRGGATYSDDLL